MGKIAMILVIVQIEYTLQIFTTISTILTIITTKNNTRWSWISFSEIYSLQGIFYQISLHP